MNLIPRSLFLAALCSTPGLLLAQPAMEWQRCLGGTSLDKAYAGKQTVDGGYIIAGVTNSSDMDVDGYHGGGDMWVAKLDASGSLQWQQCRGGSSAEWANSIQQTADGGFIAAGITYSNDGEVSGNHGGLGDMWVVKLDALGALQWQKCLGGSDEDEAHAIAQTADGGYIVAGRTQSTNGDVSGSLGSYDGWVVKLNATGEMEWQRCVGGALEDIAYAVQQTSDGGYIVAGNSESCHGSIDIWVVKLDAQGTELWEHCWGGTHLEFGRGLDLTPDDGYVVAGMTRSTNGHVSGLVGEQDFWVVKVDAAGDLQWQKCLGGTTWDHAKGIQRTADGGYIVAGYTNSTNGDVSGQHGAYDMWVVKLDEEGEMQWQHALGGTANDEAFAIEQATDGGYLVVGFTHSSNGDVSGHHGDADMWVVKLAGSGTTGMANLSTPTFTASPNPVSDVLTLHFAEQARPTQLRVINASGRAVLAQGAAAHNSAVTLHLGALQSGTYMVEVLHADGARVTQRIVKQ